jgi:hypothetical protein
LQTRAFGQQAPATHRRPGEQQVLPQTRAAPQQVLELSSKQTWFPVQQPLPQICTSEQQAPFEQTSPSGQLTQATPLVPQATASVPSRQNSPSQQPPQSPVQSIVWPLHSSTTVPQRPAQTVIGFAGVQHLARTEWQTPLQQISATPPQGWPST